MRIKHYVTAFSNDVVKLDHAVNDLIAKGYQPYGNPYVSDCGANGGTDRFLACQSMVLYENPLQNEGGSALV